MAVTPTEFADLDPSLVEQIYAQQVMRVQEDNAALDVRRGPLAEPLMYYHALLEAQVQDSLAKYIRSRSLLDLETEPDLAGPDEVDAVVSNFRLTRLPGSVAGGEVTIILSDDLTVSIAAGAVFTSSGRRYLTPRAYTAKAESGQINSAGDRLLTPTAEGNWSFTVLVEAADEGPEYRLRKDVLIVPASLPAGYVTSYASSDFSGGSLVETNSELLARLEQGMSDKKALSNRPTMNAFLRAQEDFAEFLHSSIIGLGDPEMLRDQHTLWPGSVGGRVDWYIRTALEAAHAKKTVTASCIEVESSGDSIWQFGLGRDDAPGFYEVRRIRPVGSEETGMGYEIVEDVRTLDLTGDGPLPDVATLEEGAYSRFQAGIIRFRDLRPASAALGVGGRQDYDIETVAMPQIGEIQDLVSSRDVSHYGADCLVKAPVPCYVTVAISIVRQRNEADPDTEAIAAAVAEDINRIGFIGRLYASSVLDVVHAYLRNATAVSAIDLVGRIRYPDGTVRRIRSDRLLEIPEEPASMVSAKTVQFLASAEEVLISVVAGVPSTP